MGGHSPFPSAIDKQSVAVRVTKQRQEPYTIRAIHVVNEPGSAVMPVATPSQESPDNMSQDAEQQTVTVYVRKFDIPAVRAFENEEGRRMSFRMPTSIDVFELIERGYAIDGNQAVMDIQAYVTEGGRFIPLADALREEQLNLLAYLREKGFSPQFG